MLQLKSPREIDTMAAGGRILAEAHRAARDAIAAGVSTWEIDQVVEESALAAGISSGAVMFGMTAERPGSKSPHPKVSSTSSFC